MEEEQLDLVLVPLGVLLMGAYHVWLVFKIKRSPKRTVIGINALSREQWVISMMAELGLSYLLNKEKMLHVAMLDVCPQDPMRNGVLAVQTIRNNIMASTLLATTAITLSSIIGVFVSSKASSSKLVYGNKTDTISSVKHFLILVCFLVAFLCNVQSIRYYAHVSFLVTLPTIDSRGDSVAYVTRSLNRGSYFWSLGLRAFYLSFPLFLWIFGPIPMFLCCCIMLGVLYFLDTTTTITRNLHSHSLREDLKSDSVQAV
ncbi:hypothetical protein Syun_021865 [Stephania yunnanensis]|uniref:Uncharacterized protein n=1 Tax=Stephania yunnanensis TaxID=152371 RepID=A0AAP0IHE0_9MAGN